jgi:hypothetical protein
MKWMMTSEEIMEEAMRWVGRNPEGWRFLESWAKGRAKAHKPFTTTQLVYAVKDSGLVRDKTGRAVGFRCALRAPMARLLIRESPEIEPWIRIQPSKTDTYFKDVLDMKKERMKRKRPKAQGGVEKMDATACFKGG